MEQSTNPFLGSRASIVGLFAVLCVVLTIPLVVLSSQQRQDLRGNAAETKTFPTVIPASQRASSISGYVYYDKNADGQRNNEEEPIPNVTVTINEIKKSTAKASDPEKLPREVKTDSFGYFKYIVPNTTADSQEYIIKLILPAGYKTITTNPVIVEGLHKDTNKIVEFGLFPLSTAIPTVAAPTCIPRPACLDATPSCKLAEPAPGWCPAPTATSQPTCMLRPACLNATPACKLPEPAQGWCPVPSVAPTSTQTTTEVKGD